MGKRRPEWLADVALGQLTSWYAIALRIGGALIFAAVGPLAANGGVSTAWLATILATLGAWSALFVWLVLRSGLRWPVVVADALIISLLVSAHRLVVPVGLITAGTTWMLPLASTSVFILQLAFPPMLSLPGAAVITAVYITTAGHPTAAWILPLQAVVTASLMTLIRRAGRNAEAAISAQIVAEQELRAAAARRADEREAHRQLHDTVLSTLTMVALGAFAGRSPTLSAQAARDLEVLSRPDDGPSQTNDPADVGVSTLAERLRQVASEAAPLVVRLDLAQVSAPPNVVEPIARSVAEALRNVYRHAETSEADISLRGAAGAISVEVADHGRGFDLAAVPAGRRGLSESIISRMMAAGGSAEVASGPGMGTRVVLRWPS